MNCTIELHDELSQNYIICPFFCAQIREINNKNNKITNCCGEEISEIDY